jgi:4-alpha-glucanotransferase
LFNWDNKESLSWWEERIELAKEMFDIVRIDHFRAFSAFYAIDNGEKNARQGRWIKGPGAELFLKIGKANIVAEDLGVIDDDVRDLLIKTGYPGMRVLEFAFDGNPKNEHKPSNYNENCFAYTGTHDNPPLISYIESLDENKLNLFDVDLMRECKIFGIEFENETNQKRAECAIKLLLSSRAGAVILPMQDMLFMSEKARINTPSKLTANNWSYRFLPSHFSKAVSSRIKEFLNVRNL